MKTSNPPLPLGYSAIAPGRIANFVTCLEMTEPPPRPTASLHVALDLQPLKHPDVDLYRDIFRRVGEDWLWCARLVMPDEDLRAILKSPQVEGYILRRDRRPIGLLELDFREAGQCEIAYFGLVKEAIGQGAGRYLM